jgi:hypothetical protein
LAKLIEDGFVVLTLKNAKSFKSIKRGEPRLSEDIDIKKLLVDNKKKAKKKKIKTIVDYDLSHMYWIGTEFFEEYRYIPSLHEVIAGVNKEHDIFNCAYWI